MITRDAAHHNANTTAKKQNCNDCCCSNQPPVLLYHVVTCIMPAKEVSKRVQSTTPWRQLRFPPWTCPTGRIYTPMNLTISLGLSSSDCCHSSSLSICPVLFSFYPVVTIYLSGFGFLPNIYIYFCFLLLIHNWQPIWSMHFLTS